MAATFSATRNRSSSLHKQVCLSAVIIILFFNVVRIDALVACKHVPANRRLWRPLLEQKRGIFALRGGSDSGSATTAVSEQKSTLLERLLANTSLSPVDHPSLLEWILALLCTAYVTIGSPFAQYSPFLQQLSKRNEKKERPVDAETLARLEREALRREQDEEFEKSLMEDKVKEAERRRKQEEVEAAERAIAEQEHAVKSKLDALAAGIKTKTARLTQEPPAGASAVMLRIRCPDGLQLTRRFRPDDPVEVVYDFVDVKRHEKAAAAGKEEGLLQLAEQEYTLVSTMPRLVLADRAATITAAGIKSSCALLVQPVAAA